MKPSSPAPIVATAVSVQTGVGVSGIPGTVTEVSLTFVSGIDYAAWSDSLELLGKIGGGVQWWIADAINWGANRFGEQFSQALERLGAAYATQTLLNISYVGRAIPIERRRGFPLTFSHHATVAFLAPQDQDQWLDWAITGDTLANGEKKPWSVTRLREAMRAGTAKRVKTRQPTEDDDADLPARVMVGTLLDIDRTGLCKVVAIDPTDTGILVQCVRLS